MSVCECVWVCVSVSVSVYEHMQVRVYGCVCMHVSACEGVTPSLILVFIIFEILWGGTETIFCPRRSPTWGKL